MAGLNGGNGKLVKPGPENPMRDSLNEILSLCITPDIRHSFHSWIYPLLLHRQVGNAEGEKLLAHSKLYNLSCVMMVYKPVHCVEINVVTVQEDAVESWNHLWSICSTILGTQTMKIYGRYCGVSGTSVAKPSSLKNRGLRRREKS